MIKKTTKKCNWKRTYTKNTKVTKSGKNYVYFRVVDKKNIKGRISKVTLVKIDNDGPEIKKVEKKETSSSAKVSIKAFNRWSKIKKYYYKLEDGKYIESDSDTYQIQMFLHQQFHRVSNIETYLRMCQR